MNYKSGDVHLRILANTLTKKKKKKIKHLNLPSTNTDFVDGKFVAELD